MAVSRIKMIASWILAILVALGYVLAAFGKLSGAQTEMFEGWGYAPWFATVIGVLELLGAVGLLIPRLTRPAILGLTGLMIGAAYTHISNAEAAQLVRPLIFTGILWTVWWLRRDRSPS